ncbi:MAG: peptide chain release factor N(5)-glutamine methyltransferase [Gemmatimonadota bacterium]|nr:MAG: peptide chain release factor N(5)-glutamine methyltransferase [Gemmatimonadota bacterium]
MPTLDAALQRGRRTLSARAGADARREATFLLAGVLGITPGQVALQRGRQLAEHELDEYLERLTRRARGEPLQYIEGRAAFRELSLRVDRSVLIPRPETEQLVEAVLRWCRGKEGLLGLDLGTGSGAIAISLALEGPFTRVVGVDISAEALNVARCNADEAGVGGVVDLRLGSLFDALRSGERFQIVVSNPPYIAVGEALPEEVRDWEPAVALYAGPTGLEVIQEIVDGAPRYLAPGGLLALEVAPGVADAALQRIRTRGGYGEPRVIRDLAGHRRIVLAER